MAYDKNIPDVLQLLRLDLGNVDYTVPSDTTIARYTIVGDYFPRYCIADVTDDADTMDIQGAIEETMHTILDYGGTPEDLRTAMGLVPEAEIDSDIIESGEYVPVDLGYCLDGQLTGFEVLPLDECDIKDMLNGHQIENVMTALNNLPLNLRLPAAKVLSQGDYTEWQAYQICKAFEVGVDADVIAERIANPVLNHAQMRELRRIAVHTDFADHDASPYKKDVFKTLSNGEYTAEHLHQARELMKTTAIHDIVFPHDWLKLDSRQMEVVRHALKSDVPMDALEEYADGTYTADHMNVITMALTEGIPAPPVPEHVSDRTAAIADDLILSSRCPIVESMRYQGSAGYAPGSDRILIAPRETFLSDETFTRVLLHEMTHSTGHSSALNRGCNTNFGSPEYAQEELVAELGSLFLSADLGIQNTDYEGEHYENHVSYLQSWMHALEDDPSYLFKAAAKADKAGTLIIGRYNDVLEKRRDRDVERAPEKVSLKGEVTAMKDAAKSHDEQAKAPEIAVSAR